ncbi:T9SS type A sorting domain-containing protein [Dyadobacter psychrophilus]|uniref:Por secretion system C-terminal sorting domain-containing protein n=1 Tax=Dyadobacter psychrophilus TaxID=651661 RepID=A0A1T5F998_9BACT|nr:T9SS type A sorting domain-containing protein [Dyadobacter psychrophilus]SKB92707.1 Por secretion system C-terminal sorting domain-containing protein [Dyadobacter psychrophilus]
MKISIHQLIKELAMKGSRSTLGFIMIFVLLVQSVSAQEYVSSATSDANPVLFAPATAGDPDNMEGVPDGNSTTISASGIIVSFINRTSDASVTLTFPNSIAAGKKAYIRITDPVISGISLSLDPIANVLGLLENNIIDVTTNAGDATTEMVRDAGGNLFLAVTSDEAFLAVTVEIDFANSTSLLTATLASVSMSFEHGVVYENSALTPCQAVPFAFVGRDPKASGIAITLTDALQNPQRAIDGDLTAGNFSLLQNGTVAVASSVYENIYLGKTAPGSNEVIAFVSRPGALANVDLIANVTIQAYLGNDPIGSPQSVRQLLLDVELLGLFTSSGIARVSFVPGSAYDRIEIRSRTFAGVSAFTGIQVHEVASRPPVTFTGGDLLVYDTNDNVDVNLTTAVAYALDPDFPSNPAQPGFSIACGTPGDYTYSLKDVTLVTGRTTAGTLPNTFSLTTGGALQGNANDNQTGIYFFDVEARNALGQTAVTTFKIIIEPTLPVTLVSFKASSEGPTALLSWSTASETNSDRFDIERSQNGKQWDKIGSVKSNRESVSQRFYDFKDTQPLEGQNLYRLKMVDLDETFAYSHIENLKFASTAFLYPNPVRNAENLNLNLADWSKIKQVKVVNALGKTVFEASNALSTGISTRNLSSGSYVVQVIHINGTISAHKFVRQ